MKSGQKYFLERVLEVVEVTFEGKEESKQRMSSFIKKKKVVITVNSQMAIKLKEVILDASKTILQTHKPAYLKSICISAKIVSDKWRANHSLKDIHDIDHRYSNNGANFKQVDKVLVQVRLW